MEFYRSDDRLSFMQRILYPFLCAALLLSGVYALSSNEEAPITESDNYGASVAQLDSGVLEGNDKNEIIQDNKNTMNAIIRTNMGDITVELAKDKPITVANFAKLAGEGFYDGTKFHRVIRGFMNQGGDPLTKDDSRMAYWGTGGPGYTFPDEIGAVNRNVIGTLSMANAGPNTNGSQFFINVADNSFLDQKHTVFGKVIAGMDVVMAINNIETGENDRPTKPVVIHSIDIK